MFDIGMSVDMYMLCLLNYVHLAAIPNGIHI